MCGIWFSAGHLGADARAVAQQALDLVRHRGPAAEGIWSGRDDPPVVLGHRRLAIIAPGAQANQPMVSADGRHGLTFNGEIYNYRELRADLRRDGISLRGDSDTEVLLALLVRHGPRVLRELQGFFAFVLFDRWTGRLLAARDRFGIKPLYFRAAPGSVAFASEIKQFFALPGFHARLNGEAVAEYLAFNLFDHGEGTFFQGVSQVEPGDVVDMSLEDLRGGRIAPRPWTTVREDELTDASRALSEIRPALEAAVGRALVSDVPLGVALSGGIDSSSVSSLAARAAHPGGPLRAFGVFFADAEIAEAPFARAVAEKSGLALTEITVDPDELEELFCATLWSFDEPVVRGSQLAQLKLYRAFREAGLTVVLSGQGGDEMFCGYPSAWPSLLLDLLAAGGPQALFGQAGSVPDWLRAVWTETYPFASLQEILRHAQIRLSPIQTRLAGAFDWEVALSRLCRGRLAREPGAGATHSTRWSQRLIGANSLPMLLHYDDRTSMAAGVESRPALLDLELARIALALPAREKVAGGQLKGAVRAALHDVLPPLVSERQGKLGFPVPERRWQSTPFGDFLLAQAQAALEEFPAELAPVLDIEEMRRRLRARQFRGTPVWFLASLGVWSRRFRNYSPKGISG